jgi:hypothetical protein
LEFEEFAGKGAFPCGVFEGCGKEALLEVVLLDILDLGIAADHAVSPRIFEGADGGPSDDMAFVGGDLLLRGFVEELFEEGEEWGGLLFGLKDSAVDMGDGFEGKALEVFDLVAFEPLLGKVAEDRVDIGAALVERREREDATKEVGSAGVFGVFEVELLRRGEQPDPPREKEGIVSKGLPELCALCRGKGFELVDEKGGPVAVRELLEGALLLEVLKESRGLERDEAPFALVEYSAGAMKFLCEFFAFVRRSREVKKGAKGMGGEADFKGRSKALLKTRTDHTTTRKDFTNLRQRHGTLLTRR